MKEIDNMDSLLDDLDSLGISVTRVTYIKKEEEIKVGDYDFGYGLVQKYRTANGIRISSLYANDDLNICEIIFDNKTKIILKNIALGRIDSIFISSGGKEFSLNIPRHSLEAFWRIGIIGAKHFNGFTPAIAISILKLLKVKIDLPSGNIDYIRNENRINSILNRLPDRYYSGIFPISKKIVSKCIGLDLVPVFAIDKPTGKFIHLA